jgi:hypothetical protein
MLRRFISRFRGDELPDDQLQETVLATARPKQIIAEDRFRVRILPAPDRYGNCDSPHPSLYWLEMQFREGRNWRSLLCFQEGKLDVVRDVLYEAGRWLDEQRDRPRLLPTIRLGDRRFYVDRRLSQLRNVDDPNDFYDVR